MPIILRYVFLPDELPQQPSILHADEDYWLCRVAPVWFSLLAPGPWQFEQNESPTLQTALDFSDWTNPVAPIRAYPVPQTFTFDDVFTSPAPTLAADEDFWTCGVAPVASCRVPRAFSDDELAEIVPPIQDEDFWRNPVAPVFAYSARVFLDDEIFPVAPPIRDEDFWSNAVAPIAASNWLPLPYLPDADEIPAGYLFVVSVPEVLGVGTVTPQVSGAGTATASAGVGRVDLVAGDGRVN
jgi:hypothetical protein